MKKLFCFTLSMVFVLGVLFPVSRTSEGKSPFLEQIKKIFHYSPGYEGEAKVKKGPAITSEGETGFFQEIRNIFHYFPEKVETPEVKKSPLGLEKIFKKQPVQPAEETK